MNPPIERARGGGGGGVGFDIMPLAEPLDLGANEIGI